MPVTVGMSTHIIKRPLVTGSLPVHKRRNDGLPSMYTLRGTPQGLHQGEEQPVYGSEVTSRASCFSDASAIHRVKKGLPFLSLE